MFYLIKRRKLEILHRRALNFPNRTKKWRETDSASVSEASPNALRPDTSISSRHLAWASTSIILGHSLFGEFQKPRIKKSTLPYVVSMLCPIHSCHFKRFLLSSFSNTRIWLMAIWLRRTRRSPWTHKVSDTLWHRKYLSQRLFSARNQQAPSSLLVVTWVTIQRLVYPAHK